MKPRTAWRPRAVEGVKWLGPSPVILTCAQQGGVGQGTETNRCVQGTMGVQSTMDSGYSGCSGVQGTQDMVVQGTQV